MKRDVFWSGLEAAGSAVFSLGGAFVVARLIGPAELGIGAAAVAVHVLLWVTVNALFADAIVQRATLEPGVLPSGVHASAAAGCVAAVIQAGAGWALAAVFGDGRLIAMGLALAVPLPFVGLAGALQGLVTRQRRYRALAARTLTGQSVGLAAGASLAYLQAGAWAPVIQQAAVSLIAAIVLIAVVAVRPGGTAPWRGDWHWSAVRELLRVGGPLTASTLVQIGRYRLFAILIGGIAGPAALGQIHIAFRLADTVREIMFTALWRLLLPRLAVHQTDRAARLAEVDRLLRLSACATLPISGALAVGLVPLTRLLLGPAWGQAGLAAVPLAGLMALLALMFPSGAALAAEGQARFTLYANLAGLAATVVFVLAVRPDTPDGAVLVWCGAQVFVTPYSLWINGRALGVGPFRPLRAGLPMALVTVLGVLAAVALVAADPPWRLLPREAVFAAVTGGGLWTMFARMRGLPRWRDGSFILSTNAGGTRNVHEPGRRPSP